MLAVSRDASRVAADHDEPSHSDRGLRRLLVVPVLYRALQGALGAGRVRTRIVDGYLRPRPGDAVLDLGCGAGDLLAFLPDSVRYTGIDLNPRYIGAARRRFGGRGRFVVGDVTTIEGNALEGPFDRIAILALLHHLKDEDAEHLLAVAGSQLCDTGSVVTLDAVLVEGQSRVARFVISRDRGRRVRSPEGYRSLLERTFREVTSEVRHDLLRIPYSHFVALASQPRG